jgi:hypothetical protein
MSGSSNFLQFNPTGANQETDSAYSADALRTGGAVDPSIFTSALANKIFCPMTTFVSALAQALAAKGYVLSDANLASLAGVLANVTTQADLTSALALYAPKVSPALSGVPTAPTAATADNPATVATTAFVKGQGYINSITAAMVLSALGFTPIQQGGGASQAANKIYLGWDGSRMRVQTDTTDRGELAFEAELANYAQLAQFPASLVTPGYQKLPNGLIIQWNNNIDGSGHKLATWTYPIPFPANVFAQAFTAANGGSQLYGTVSVIQGPGTLSSVSVSASLNGATRIGGPVSISGIAIGN